MQQYYDGLRSFLTECEQLGKVTLIRDAELIGAFTA
jgi:hypothetical protein